MSPGLALVGISILGTWGIGTAALIASGVIMIFFPGEQEAASSHMVGGIFLLVAGLVSGGAMQMVVNPLLGIDMPLPMKAKNNIAHDKMKSWVSAGRLEDYPENMPTEIRRHSMRVTIVRVEDRAYALNALCSHARLPMAGFPGSPIKAIKVKDDCITCPFHGAQFEVETGKVTRQPFTSEWNSAHPILGGLQSKMLFFNKKAEDSQTYPVRVEDGEIMVGLPK